MTDSEFSMTTLMDILVEKAGLPETARTGITGFKMADIGLDSLAFLSLEVELISRYGVELPGRPDDHTFGDIVTLVNDSLAKGAVQ
ncbi:acyl carrier protein [Streptomyces triticagri]|uniref:acyl carrier protein n=1 Tax=Streptomyces triticagri TaxID=2293568 RepID=UPI001F42857B|nr:acyl carrier protein [Streptomyces triticagri]